MFTPDPAVVETPGCLAIVLSWGLTGVSLLAFGEKLVPVVPSYVLLVFLGMTSVSNTGNLVLMILATSIGSTAGAVCWYGGGRMLGPIRSQTLVQRYGRYVCLRPLLYQRMTGAYRRNQFWVTLCGQTIPVVRIYLPIPAGVIGLHPGLFASATFLGSLLWNTALLSLGYGLRGANTDPLHVGLIAVGSLITAETVLMLVLRLSSGQTLGAGRCSS